MDGVLNKLRRISSQDLQGTLALVKEAQRRGEFAFEDSEEALEALGRLRDEALRGLAEEVRQKCQEVFDNWPCLEGKYEVSVSEICPPRVFNVRRRKTEYDEYRASICVTERTSFHYGEVNLFIEMFFSPGKDLQETFSERFKIVSFRKILTNELLFKGIFDKNPPVSITVPQALKMSDLWDKILDISSERNHFTISSNNVLLPSLVGEFWRVMGWAECEGITVMFTEP